ncbi:hypothetical protein [Paenibacillus aestuarii]|uniref:ACT domain-containing protein n=1 Tax=Paenibacillus aestuarii TaxID=516965 RepID=A0ABW0KJK0_9BACL|nr:hypothetical protein [Paenibacillus aestuarii]
MAKQSGRFTLRIRTQFQFRASDRTLNRILGAIANQHINITGYNQMKKGSINAVTLVVGPPNMASPSADAAVRQILRGLHVMFRERSVIRISNIPAGIPGINHSIYQALFRKVRVNAMYDGEENATFVQTSNNREAIQILREI